MIAAHAADVGASTYDAFAVCAPASPSVLPRRPFRMSESRLTRPPSPPSARPAAPAAATVPDPGARPQRDGGSPSCSQLPPNQWWTWYGLGEPHRIRWMSSGASGPPEAPPVVLVHGFGSSCGHWRHTLPGLTASARVWAFDLLGFGNSDKPPPCPRYPPDAAACGRAAPHGWSYAPPETARRQQTPCRCRPTCLQGREAQRAVQHRHLGIADPGFHPGAGRGAGLPRRPQPGGPGVPPGQRRLGVLPVRGGRLLVTASGESNGCTMESFPML
jgi:hypothetical protein